MAVADLFARDFATQGSLSSGAESVMRRIEPLSFEHCKFPWYNNDFTSSELTRALSSLSSSSPGPDNIPYEFMKHLTPEQERLLLNFYNHLWNNGLPHQWKFSQVIPIYKPGKPPSQTTSYRPIALTSSLCKIMERLVVRRLQLYLEKNHTLSPYQSGYRMGHSPQDALFRLESSIRLNLIKGNFTIGIFIDIAQAFDSISHPHLIKKIADLGLKGNLSCFIEDFISTRRLSVKYADILSPPNPVHYGVPQGSVISPTLFLIMINDICCRTSGIQYSLYADDCAIWTSGHSLLECTSSIQAALDTIAIWANMWGLRLTTRKTKAVLFTRRRVSPLELFLAGSPVEFVNKHTFLGVILDRTLTWRPQVNLLKDRCQGDLGLLRVISAQGWGADFYILRRLYETLICSKMDYAGFLYSSASRTVLQILDRIQYAAARIMLGVLKCTPVVGLEAEAHLLPLAHRRRKLLISYAARVCTIPSHPCRELILNYVDHNFYKDQDQPLPALSQVHTEVRALGIPFSQFPQIQLMEKLSIYTLPVRATLHETQKNSMSMSQTAWRQAFMELLENYPNYTPVYTDGSVKDSRCGAGAWHSSFTLHARLPSYSSILTVELYAIYTALEFLAQWPEKYLLLSDSLSSVNALQNISSRSHYLTFKCAKVINSSPTKFAVEWLPSHVGITGNENTDAAAAVARELREVTQLPVASNDFKRLIKAKAYMMWQHEWSKSRALLHEIKQVLNF